MQRPNDHMARLRQVQRKLYGFQITHLADHDDIRRLPEYASERIVE